MVAKYAHARKFVCGGFSESASNRREKKDELHPAKI